MTRTAYALFSLIFLLGTLAGKAQEKGKEKYEFSKEKNVSKTYTASGNKLFINNSFGNVKYISWEKNEIKVDVHVTVSANKEDVANKLIEAINISDKQDGSDIKFKTSINNNNNDCKNCKSTMDISYEVHLPTNVTLNSENSFGNTELPDYPGQLSVISKFGELTAGKLGNVKDIQVEFGKATIEGLLNIDASFKFSTITIGSLAGKNKINLEFCDATKISVDNNLASLVLKESYSTVNLRTSANFSASYTIFSSFGTVIDRSNSNIKRTDTPDQYGPDSEKNYSGQSGSGAAKIDISSSFGKIIVGEPNAGDMTEKDKSKNKSKNSKQSI